jgi:membrane-associated protease RseP (regulator of RpoE activity)
MNLAKIFSDKISTYIIFILAIYSSVFLHEIGHLISGKLVNIPIKVFSLGIGHEVISFNVGELRFRLGLFPGGFVKPEFEKQTNFFDYPLSKRITYLAGGMLANLVCLLLVALINRNYSTSLQLFVLANIIVLAFNLLPAVYTDGGKIIYFLLDQYFPGFVRVFLYISLFISILTLITVIVLLYFLSLYIWRLLTS